MNVAVRRSAGIYESPSHEVISVVFECRYLDGELVTSNETRDVTLVERISDVCRIGKGEVIADTVGTYCRESRR